MELIVLGASAAYPRPGGACSGYLVRDSNTNLLVDCGTGILSNLFRWVDPAYLDAIVITHLHTDHFLDIYPLRYYLQYEKRLVSPIPVFVPSGGEQHILKLISEESVDIFSEVFRFIPINEEINREVGSLQLIFFPVPHYKRTYGVVVTGEKRIVFSSDCGLRCKPILKKMAFAADLLVCEATLQERTELLEEGHLTAEQAGEIAAAAKIKKLLLSHIWGSLNPEFSKTQAKKIFGGEVEVGKENQRVKT